MRLTEGQLKRLYGLEQRHLPYGRTLQCLCKQIYPLVVKVCTYHDSGRRRFKTGGTPALVKAMDCFADFVEEHERGFVSFQIFDAVLWACHNNGVFADEFIKADSEWAAIDVLSRVSGIVR